MKQLKKTNRLFAMALAVVMTLGLVIVTPNVAFANAPTLDLVVVTPADEIYAGAEVRLEVRIANNPAFSQLAYNLTFDSVAIEADSFDRAPGTVGRPADVFGFGYSIETATGWSTRMVNNTVAGATGEGSVSVYTFTVADDVAVGVNIGFTLVPVVMSDTDGTRIETVGVGTATVNLITVEATVDPTGLTIVSGPSRMLVGGTGTFVVTLDPYNADIGDHRIVWSSTGAVVGVVADAGGLSAVATAGATTGAGTVRATLETAAGAPLGYVQWAVDVRDADPANVTINAVARWGLQEVTVTVENVTGGNITDGYIVATTNAVGAVPSLVVLRGINLAAGETDTFTTNLFVRPGTLLATWVMTSIPAAGPTMTVLHDYNIGVATPVIAP